MLSLLKKYSTIGCCGIDCGLCPRFHTKGDSACPGCGGLDFKDKHPSCGFLTCCSIKKGLEVCSDCNDYPCSRFDKERQGYDSFVTHKKVFENLDNIKDNGINVFIDQQKIRMDILNDLLTNFDDGRSKSFFCISCALLPLDKLQKAQKDLFCNNDSIELKEKNKRIRDKFQSIADNIGVQIKLNNKIK
jgi:hypothetical protein